MTQEPLDNDRFPSRIDAWLVSVIALAMGIPMGLIVYQIVQRRENLVGLLLVVGFLLPIALFIAWIFRTTSYTVERDALLVRSGPFRWSVALASVVSIRPSRNPLSSPALSLRRLEVRYGSGKTVLISPREIDEFLRVVVTRDPGLVLEGGSVRRRDAR